MVTISLMCCNKEEVFNPSVLPECKTVSPTDKCILNKIEEFKAKYSGQKDYSIKKTTYRNQLVFMFDYCSACDGPTVLINNCCATIGELCGDCYPDSFHRDFIRNSSGTMLVWP